MDEKRQTIKIYGPYYRSSIEDKWHWKFECPHFPAAIDPQTRISTTSPEETSLCNVCAYIENNLYKAEIKKLKKK